MYELVRRDHPYGPAAAASKSLTTPLFVPSAVIPKHLRTPECGSNSKLHVCRICRKMFAAQRFNDHLWAAHNVGHAFECPVCRKRFRVQQVCQTHMEKFHFLCQPTSSSGSRSILTPQAVVVKETQLAGSSTGAPNAADSTEAVLLQPLVTDDLKHFLCRICKEQTEPDMAVFRSHLRMCHKNETKPLFCGGSRVSNTPFRLPCSKCGTFFRTLADLQQHTTSCRILSSQICSLCGQWFPTTEKLRVHELQKHEKCDVDDSAISASTESMNPPVLIPHSPVDAVEPSPSPASHHSLDNIEFSAMFSSVLKCPYCKKLIDGIADLEYERHIEKHVKGLEGDDIFEEPPSPTMGKGRVVLMQGYSVESVAIANTVAAVAADSSRKVPTATRTSPTKMIPGVFETSVRRNERRRRQKIEEEEDDDYVPPEKEQQGSSVEVHEMVELSRPKRVRRQSRRVEHAIKADDDDEEVFAASALASKAALGAVSVTGMAGRMRSASVSGSDLGADESAQDLLDLIEDAEGNGNRKRGRKKKKKMKDLQRIRRFYVKPEHMDRRNSDMDRFASYRTDDAQMRAYICMTGKQFDSLLDRLRRLLAHHPCHRNPITAEQRL
uniref:C2H2-type domain-containing protein n=1 Tax=Plectus sambesii TaxID=2011161 RepID=A0A914UN13_9BILA